MTKADLINKLNRRDLPGVGAIVKYANGNACCYFYQDFEDSRGIDRASETFTKLINSGRVRRVDYIHKGPDLLHFFDWKEKPDTFCASDEFIRYNKCFGIPYYYHMQRFISVINGTEYKYDYTPAIDGISAIKATKI